MNPIIKEQLKDFLVYYPLLVLITLMLFLEILFAHSLTSIIAVPLTSGTITYFFIIFIYPSNRD